jgi:hypothetical protein
MVRPGKLARTLLPFLIPFAVQAQPCWVKDVLPGDVAAPDTLRIRFYPLGPSQRISVSRGRESYSIRQGRVRRVERVNGFKVTDIGESLVVRDGDVLNVFSGYHDSCTIHAVVEAGKRGIDVQASTEAPGLPPETVKTFVPAIPSGTR